MKDYLQELIKELIVYIAKASNIKEIIYYYYSCIKLLYII